MYSIRRKFKVKLISVEGLTELTMSGGNLADRLLILTFPTESPIEKSEQLTWRQRELNTRRHKPENCSWKRAGRLNRLTANFSRAWASETAGGFPGGPEPLTDGDFGPIWYILNGRGLKLRLRRKESLEATVRGFISQWWIESWLALFSLKSVFSTIFWRFFVN